MCVPCVPCVLCVPLYHIQGESSLRTGERTKCHTWLHPSAGARQSDILERAHSYCPCLYPAAAAAAVAAAVVGVAVAAAEAAAVDTVFGGSSAAVDPVAVPRPP